MTAPQAMAVLGGVAQLGGVSLVAWEVRATRRLHEYVFRPQVREGAAARETETASAIRPMMDPPPPAEERLRQLEDLAWARRARVTNLPTELAPGLRSEIREAGERVFRVARRETDALVRTLLALNDARSLSLRELSIALIVVGVVVERDPTLNNCRFC